MVTSMRSSGCTGLWFWLSVAVVLLRGLDTTCAFSLDSQTAARYSGPAGSEFGSSVTFHRTGSDSMILVGAPTDSYSDPALSAFVKPGILYRCPWSASAASACSQLAVDTTPPIVRSVNVDEVKNNMRMGETVLSGGPDRPVLVCATRYGQMIPCTGLTTYRGASGVCFGNNVTTSRMFDPIGKCVVLPPALSLTGVPNDFSPILPASPISASYEVFMNRVGVNTRIFKAIGFASFVTSVLGTSLFGSSQNSSQRFPITQMTVGGPGFVFNTGNFWTLQMNATGIQSQRQQILLTSVPQSGDSSSAAAAVTGDFDGNMQEESAIGRPTTNISALYRGCVDIVKTSASNTLPTDVVYGNSFYLRLVGHQFGEGYGNSLLSVDTNGDGTWELLVGASFYMDMSRSNEVNAHDFGRVYYYSGTLKTAMLAATAVVASTYRTGSPSAFDFALVGEPGSRFGHTMASVGDIDRDGYQDVAIGAPGEYINGAPAGAVYLYLGSSTGLTQTYAQRIVSSQSATRGFGSSLAYGWDIDGNGYSDVAVGAAMSSEAFIYRSRPVIVVSLDISGVASIDATYRNCSFGGQMRACFPVRVCASYTRPTQPTNAVISYTLTVATGTFELLQGQVTASQITTRVTVSAANTDFCRSHTVFVRTDIPNFCTSSNISLSQWSLVDRPSTPTDLAPILVRNHPAITPSVLRVSLIPTECAGCQPDLVTNFTVASPTAFVTSGVTSTSSVTLELRNYGNLAACAPTLEMNLLGASATFLSIDESQWACSDRGLSLLRCRPASTNRHYGGLGPGASVTITARLSTPRIPFPLSITSFGTNATAACGNTESSISNNPTTGSVDIRRTATMGVVMGDDLAALATVTDALISAESPSSLADIPFPLVASVQLRNTGPSMSTETDMVINYPIETNTGKSWIYYLVAIEASIPNVTCNSSALVNENGYATGGLVPLNSSFTFYPVGALPDVPAQNRATAYKGCSVADVCSVGVQCHLPPLGVNQVFQVRMQWKVWTRTLLSIGLSESSSVTLGVKGSIVGTMSHQGYSAISSPGSVTGSTQYSQPSKIVEQRNDGIIAGVVVGCIVLVIIIFVVLYLLGFFKRKKIDVLDSFPSAPPTEADQDPSYETVETQG